MSKFNCIACQFSTNHKTKYLKHLQTKKHVESTKNQPKVNLESTKSQPKVNLLDQKKTASFQCKYCAKDFKFKQSMYKHIKYVCKENKDESLKELARLLNEKDRQLQAKDEQLEKIHVNMQKQIDKLTEKLQIKNVVHGNVNQNHKNIFNIQLLNHVESDYSHLTNNDYKTCINDCNHCVKTLIQKVHFNYDKPENMNIYISNIKGNYAMVFKGGKWQIVNKKQQIDDLYECNEVMLETWYDDYKDQYPEVIKSFQRYLKNKDESDIINQVKEQILLMLYNNRKMIM